MTNIVYRIGSKLVSNSEQIIFHSKSQQILCTKRISCSEKVDNLQKFCSRHNNIFAGILIFLVFSKSGIQYLWQGEISACKVLVPIKVVSVKNDYYYSRIYQSRAHWPVNTNLNLIRSTYVSQIWPSNHQLSCFF